MHQTLCWELRAGTIEKVPASIPIQGLCPRDTWVHGGDLLRLDCLVRIQRDEAGAHSAEVLLSYGLSGWVRT